MTYKIEKGIPLKRNNRTINKYPFAEMEVGDSFVIPVGNRAPTIVATNLIQAATRWVKRENIDWKFSTSAKSDVDMVRIWRIK